MELADLKSALNPLMERLNTLETEMKSLRQSSASSPVKAEPATAAQAELHGLCEDPACEVCVGQIQELAAAAFAQGQVAALENLDQWLIQAGGEAFRQKIVQLAAQGKEAWEQSQQEVRIVA